jgi:hypothetical protein
MFAPHAHKNLKQITTISLHLLEWNRPQAQPKNGSWNIRLKIAYEQHTFMAINIYLSMR